MNADVFNLLAPEFYI